MGPYSQKLRYVRLSYNEDETMLLKSEDGPLLEVWASSCADMQKITSAVAKKVLTGSFDSTEEETNSAAADANVGGENSPTEKIADD
jgi:hypothetical protein